MYASLVTAGASALYDLYKSATSKTDAASDQSSATNAGPTSGSAFSDALNKLSADLQSSTTGAASTSTVANDLHGLSKGLNAAGAHGHRHGLNSIDDGQTASADGSSNPFGGLASSLVAYAKTQSLSASASTSLTA